MAICSWISIPAPVPFTLQTFAVFLAPGLLGGKMGTIAVGTYLLLGAVGLPVFAGFSGGIGVLLGATGGYLLGFLLTTLVVWLAEIALGTSQPVFLASALVGQGLCYLFGSVCCGIASCTEHMCASFPSTRYRKADPGLVLA